MDMMTAEEYGLISTSKSDSKLVVDVTELVQLYSGLLFRVAHSVLRSRTDAEDVVQDVFVRVLERRTMLGEVQQMRVWLVRIAWNLALDRRRRIKPEQMEDEFAAQLAAGNVGPEQALAETRRMEAVFREIERLPRAERHALLLATVDELGTAEMAEVLRKTESGVRALVFRARKRLRERLGPRGEL
jgi:RNA polymerase sigma-70 factor, ECF subfamily